MQESPIGCPDMREPYTALPPPPPRSPAGFKAEAQGLQGLVETLWEKVYFDVCLPYKGFSPPCPVLLCFFHL